jgi:hypothetical protein
MHFAMGFEPRVQKSIVKERGRERERERVCCALLENGNIYATTSRHRVHWEAHKL